MKLGVCIGQFGSVISIIGSVYRFSVFKYAKPITKPIRYLLSVFGLLVLGL